ncbi:MAG: DUF1549 domain-containing protein [Planctomycetaceae bacterium]|nr:DUF1549 domain-containing protein [Planctomycetaceae bacterium]
MRIQRFGFRWFAVVAVVGFLTGDTLFSRKVTAAEPAKPPVPAGVATAVDQAIFGESLKELPLADDATYLRRVSFDIAGHPASPGQITRFGLDPSAEKRSQIVESLLADDDYAANWTRYWRDTMFIRATNMRAGLVRAAFEQWMREELSSGTGWDDIVTELLTATGPVNETGATALFFMHEGVTEEVAAEASRLFMGIQIQCANCHDHPWDQWKRDQFHEFAAFFPRVSVRRDPGSDNMFDYLVSSMDVDRSRRQGVSEFLLTRLDRNRDRILSEQELKGSPLERLVTNAAAMIDKNGDGKLSIEEITSARPADNNRPGQGSTEHYMPNLADPGSQGDRIDPAFFLSDQSVRSGLNDQARRALAADFITGRDNPWFARAIVNRMWYELTGTAFYLPVDDIGPERSVAHEEALQILCDGFVESGHDLKWLIRTITATRAYQRAPDADGEDFAKCEPVRLRSDQLYSALCQALDVQSLPLRFSGGRRNPAEMRAMDQGREEFARVFRFDPSVARDELTGSIPEALFLMNSSELEQIIRDPSAENVISRISLSVLGDQEVVSELYLRTLGREPTENEEKITATYLKDGSLREGYEDILWSLINSPEFLSRR